MAYPCISHNLLHRSPCAQPFFKPFCPDCLFHPVVFTSYPTDSETAVIAPLCRDSCHCAKPSPSPLATLASGCDVWKQLERKLQKDLGIHEKMRRPATPSGIKSIDALTKKSKQDSSVFEASGNQVTLILNL